MPNPSLVMYGPDSEPYNIYAVVSPAPGDNGSGGQIAQRGRYPFGQQLILADGRKYRFALGGVLLVPGDVIQAAAALSTSEDLTPVAAAVDSRIIDFTHGAATTVINLFAEGYATISVTPGFGQIYKIASHLALQSAVAGDIVNLAPGNAIRVALTGTSRLDLHRHPYAGVLEMPVTTITAPPVGVALSAIASGGTGWLQTRGACAVLQDSTAVDGTHTVVPSAAAGAAGPHTDTEATSNIEVSIGQIMGSGSASTAVSTVFLTIDG